MDNISKGSNNFDSVNAHLPFSQACENNKQAILEVLEKELVGYLHILEVGSGTGQHGVYFAPNLPHLTWQTSDVVGNHSVIQAWLNAHPASNLHAPLRLDLRTDCISHSSTAKPYDAVFTANTLHIIAWSLVEKLFELMGSTLAIDGKLVIYGPFNENGQYTSAGNQQFDTILRQGNPSSGIRNKEDVIALADHYDLAVYKQYAMPANNQMLIFKKR